MNFKVLQMKDEDQSPNSRLFRTKLHIPVIRQKLASRTRLDKELSKGLNGKLILITAPAGFGKTTAVAEWIKQVSIPAAWFSIDSYDNSLKRFWSYLIAALNGILPGIENGFSQYLYSTNTMTAEGIVTALVDELFKLKDDFILVMDDYHLIKEASIHESLALLINYLPENAHIVIISRLQPPFSSVRQQTIGQIKEIRIADLQFTTSEIAEYGKEMGISLSKKHLKALESCTEGWASGLYLILDSVRHDCDLSMVFSVSGRDSCRIASYLTEEVMNLWTVEEKNFMLSTSVLSSMTGPLCDALTGRTDGREMLEKLSADNAFIISLDNEGCWYRYHHLYMEFLQMELKKNKDLANTELHELAGMWYEKNGYPAEAVDHFIQSGKYEKAAASIEKSAPDMLKTGDLTTLIGWLESFPDSIVRDSDILCLIYAWALVLSDRLKEAVSWISDLELRGKAHESMDTAENGEIQLMWEVIALKGIVGIKSNDPKTIFQIITQTMGVGQYKSIFYLGGLNFNSGEASLLAGMFGMKGRLSIVDREYVAIYSKVRELLKRNFGYIPALMGELFFERNRMDEAIPCLMKGIDESENNGMAGSFVPSVITLAKVIKAKGDINGSFELIRESDIKLQTMGSSHMIPLLAAFRTRLNIEIGNQEAIEEWIGRNCLDIYEKPSIPRLYEQITLTRVLIFRKEYDNGILHATRLLLFVKKEGNLLYTIEVLNLLAIIYQAMGQTQKAMETILESLGLGEKEGYERIFIEEGFLMAALLGRFLKWYFKQEVIGSLSVSIPVSAVYVRKLLKHTRDYCIILKTCMKDKSKNQNYIATMKQPLTKREKEVLRLLNSELTNAEIACTLDITVNTVKVNCTNIYRKLDVRNREQAVRQANEMYLLN